MGREQGLSLKQVPECSRNLYFIHEGQLITVKSLSQYPSDEVASGFRIDTASSTSGLNATKRSREFPFLETGG